MPMNDAALLRRYVDERSQEAFTALVEGRFNLVYSAALRQLGGDVHRARDVAQTVFMDLARKAPSLRGHSSLIGWLYTSTHYAAAKTIRGEQRRKVREGEAQMMHEINTAPAVDTAWAQIRPLLDEAIHALPEADRQALLGRYFDDQSLAEVGRDLGVSDDAAQKRVERALDRLRGLLARRGLVSTTAVLAAALANQAVTAAPAGMAAAVAGGALSGAPAFGLISLMTTSKFLGGVAAIVAVSLGTASYEIHSSLQAHAALAAVDRENASLQDRLRSVEQSAAKSTSDRDKAAAALAKAKPAAGPSSGSDDEAIARGEKFLAEHPGSRELIRQQINANLDVKYGALFKVLDLSPVQLEEFRRIMDAAAQPFGVMIPAGRFSLSPSEEHLSEDQKNEQLQNLLGPQGFQQYQDATRLAPMRSLVAQLAAASYYTPTPLTADQGSQLQSLLAAQSSTYTDGGVASPAAVDWNQAMAQAKGILSGSQLASLSLLQQQVSADRKLGVAAGASGPMNLQMQFGPTGATGIQTR
jgi:RNA polymerase sigma factor (sigma-70 family)